MRRFIPAVQRIIGLTLILACMLIADPAPLRADGMYFPEKAVRKLPEIPVQRAIISYRDGVETLIVESTLDAEGQSFGWILPVPAEPEKIEADTPGLMATLDLQLKPEIVHDRRGLPEFGIWTAICALAWSLLMLALLPKKCSALFGWFAAGVAAWLYSSFWLLVVMGGMMSGMAHKSAGSLGGVSGLTAAVDGVKELSKGRVGSYSTAALRADDAGALNAWLHENGLTALPEEGESIAEDYIRDGWVFLVSRLEREEDGLCTPHPLRVSFKTDEPVYPMRLTALSGTELMLELFVVADKSAETVALRMEYSTPLMAHGRRWSDPETGSSLRSRYQPGIEHPGASSVLWNWCWVSRLQGSLSPEQMTDDIRFRLRPGERFRRRLYSPRGAAETATALAGLGGAALLVLAIFVFWPRLLSADRPRISTLWLIGSVALISLILRGIVPSALPGTDVNVISKSGHRMERNVIDHNKISEIADSFSNTGWISFGEATKSILGMAEQNNLRNVYTGHPIGFSDCPGDLYLDLTENGWMLQYYMDDGRAIEYPVYANVFWEPDPGVE